MSIAKVEKALCNFAARESATAIVLKGEWGTGKTYFWNQVVKANFKSFSRKKYSYISLFGLNSLSDLKRSIFENTVPCSKAGDIVTKESVFENLRKLDISDAATGFRKLLNFGKEAKIPYFGSFGGVVDSIQFALISDTIICIDDFERRGSGLSSRDVLGLISGLVETKNCSAILILNEGSLEQDDEFFSFTEKVFDYEVNFSPSVQESVKLVFDSTGTEREAVAKNAIKLKINNIRLLKKIELFSKVLDDILKDTHSRVVEQAQSTLPLAVFAIYGGGKCKVDIDFILRYQGGLASYLQDNANASPDELETKRLAREKSIYLDEYGFGRCDEFDAAIIDLVKKGYANDDILKTLIDELEKKIKHETDIALLGHAWDLFHASFSNNDAEVLEAFELAISKALQHFTVNDLDSVAAIYFELGRKDFILPAIDKYFSKIFPNQNIKQKDDIFHWPRNEYISQKLDEYFDSLTIKGNLSELVRAVIQNSSFPDGDLRKSIAQKTDDEFYYYFNSLNGNDFTRCARALLKCGEIQSHDKDISDDYINIFIKSYSALLKLSALTPLNAIRMSKFRAYEAIYNKHVEDHKNKN
ncbi:KAP family NTPase [Pseudomonas sp. BW7P1]|uniref:KAP family NTPase n=1 Tax=Pseudomonas TaxID=286 RepID=UPI0021ADFC78|nr:KAP family NTPase [Pseudomonas sp. BW7P1]UWI64213.1 KAP family NTPase [Pseudomonas sp. BW7P1]